MKKWNKKTNEEKGLESKFIENQLIKKFYEHDKDGIKKCNGIYRKSKRGKKAATIAKLL